MDLSIKRFTMVAMAVVMAAALASTPVRAVSAANQTAVTTGLAYLTSQQQPDGQIAGFSGINAWAMLAYRAAGSNNSNLRAYMLAHPPATSASATEWERNILAITADGQNPYNFGGTNYVAGLKAKFSNGQLGSESAVNDDAYGVLALTAAHVPANDPVLLAAVGVMLAHQHADGGFSYSADATAGSDVDDTAAFLAAVHAALVAGVPNANVATAKVAAQTYLLSKQNADGGFLSDPAWGTSSNVSSTAVALIALNSVGLGSSPEGLKAAEYLKSTQQSDGSFPYQLPVPSGQTGDTFNSAYAIAALAGGSWPQSIYSGPLPTPAATPSPTSTPTPTTTPTPATSPASTPAPSPGPVGGSGSVLGASTNSGNLPAAGTWANQILLGLAALIAVSSGYVVYRRQRRTNEF